MVVNEVRTAFKDLFAVKSKLFIYNGKIEPLNEESLACENELNGNIFILVDSFKQGEWLTEQKNYVKVDKLEKEVLTGMKNIGNCFLLSSLLYEFSRSNFH